MVHHSCYYLLSNDGTTLVLLRSMVWRWINVPLDTFYLSVEELEDYK